MHQMCVAGLLLACSSVSAWPEHHKTSRCRQALTSLVCVKHTCRALSSAVMEVILLVVLAPSVLFALDAVVGERKEAGRRQRTNTRQTAETGAPGVVCVRRGIRFWAVPPAQMALADWPRPPLLADWPSQREGLPAVWLTRALYAGPRRARCHSPARRRLPPPSPLSPCRAAARARPPRRL
jgi:hypothetical protein